MSIPHACLVTAEPGPLPTYQPETGVLGILAKECDGPEGYRRLTVDQLGDLLQHSNYLNVELRSGGPV